MNIIYNYKFKNDKGFTLAEVLLAMLITSVLVLGINAAYRRAYLIWSDAENRRPVYYTARIMTETFREELSGLYIPPGNEDGEISGKFFRLLYLPDDGTELTFYTLNPSWRGSVESSYIAKVSYKSYRKSDSDEICFERTEQLSATDKSIGKEIKDIIVTNISEFRVWATAPGSQISDDSWIESYESGNSPPKSLKIMFKWAETEKIPEIEFTQNILISSSSPLL